MRNNTKIVATLWFLLFANYLDRVAIGFAGPAIMGSLAMSPASFGMILSSFGVGYLLAQLPGGLMADRFGAKPLLVIGALLWGLLTGLTGLASTVAAFIVARVALGLAEGVSTSCYYKTVGDNFAGKQRARILAIVLTAVTVAPAVAGFLVAELITAFGWRVMFFLMMVPAFLSALAAYLYLPSFGKAELVSNDPAAAGSYLDMLRSPDVWIFSMAAFAWNIAYWGYIGWMPSYLTLGRALDLRAAGPLSGIPYLFGFIGLLLGGWLGNRYYRYCVHIAAGGFVLAGVLMAATYLAPDVPLAVAGLSGTAFFLFSCQGPVGKIALDLAPPQHRGAFVGTFNVAGHVGGIAAPVSIGFMMRETGTFGGGFALMICACVVAAGCLLSLLKFAPRAWMASETTSD